MSTLEDRFNDPEYRRWVKAGLCLSFIKEGLEDFVHTTSQQLHQNVFENLTNSAIITNTGQPVCGAKIKGQVLVNVCQHPYCTGFLNAVKQEGLDPYQPFAFSNGNLHNTDVSIWHRDPYELAKLFMNPGQKVLQKTPAQTDLSGLLNFIDHCKVPCSQISSTNLIREVRSARNAIMSNSAFKVTETDFKTYLQSMISLLNDVNISASPTAKNAVVQIQRVMHEEDFTITMEDEAKSKIPAEILQMDERAIELYKNALEEGKEHNYSIRLMVTGPYGVGKSTLTKRLMCQDVDINDRTSTDGIDVHVKKCKVSLETSRWKMNDTVDDNTTLRLAKVLQNARAKDTADESLNTENASEDYDGVHLQDTDKETDGNDRDDNAPKSAETSTSSKTAAEAYGNITSDTGNIVDVDDVPRSSDYNRLKHKELLLKDLKDVISNVTNEDEDHADVSIWDFGGQSVFYTNHQMFLSRRAVYILVIDMSQGIHAVVEDDEPYFDCSGSKSLKIEDFLDIWLNSIHGHSDGEKSGTPKVILVGTHADKLNPDTRYKQTEAIFDAIRDRFSDKDVRFHFIEKDFGLSNAEIDPKLDDLRKTIFDVARKQSYWGEMRPAKWIPLERLLEDRRRKGVEVMSRSEVADLNRNLPVPIADDQLELFLCFQHETANIMYFRY